MVILGVFFANILMATFAMQVGHTRSLAGGWNIISTYNRFGMGLALF